MKSKRKNFLLAVLAVEIYFCYLLAAEKSTAFAIPSRMKSLFGAEYMAFTREPFPLLFSYYVDFFSRSSETALMLFPHFNERMAPHVFMKGW